MSLSEYLVAIRNSLIKQIDLHKKLNKLDRVKELESILNNIEKDIEDSKDPEKLKIMSSQWEEK